MSPLGGKGDQLGTVQGIKNLPYQKCQMNYAEYFSDNVDP